MLSQSYNSGNTKRLIEELLLDTERMLKQYLEGKKILRKYR